jgi:hypothetical protein
MKRLALVAAVIGAAGVFTAGVWLVWPAERPEVAVLERPEGRTKQARTARHVKKVPAAPRRRPEPRERPPVKEKDPQLPPDDRAEARQEFREERIQDLNDRLDAFADEAGWNEDDTDDVRVVLVETADHITNRLAAVDRGELTWDEARRELREYRLQQAGTVRELLGDEEFGPFVDAMDFARFLGDEPIRGRLD